MVIPARTCLGGPSNSSPGSIPAPKDSDVIQSKPRIACVRRARTRAVERVARPDRARVPPKTSRAPPFGPGAFEVSPDHRFLAYSVDTCGSESYTLYIKDLCTGELVPESLTNTAPAVAWANDSQTLFYIILDDARRPCRLFRHRLGDNP